MMTDIIFHKSFLKHVMSQGHPERPERLQWAIKAIEESKILLESEAKIVDATPVDLKEVYEVHQKEYIESIKKMSEQGRGFYTIDTTVNKYTFEAAIHAAGGGILAVDRIMDGHSKNAMVLCRPPGHHAEYNRAFGFCFINNIAVAANHLLNRHLRRILIIDYDAHHGNGTQNMFYDTDNILYVGLHQDGRTLFPGSGFVDEIGTGKGEGYTANIPMYPGSGKKSYDLAFTEIIEPIAENYKPQFVLVSAGFDCHYEDPLTMLGLTIADINTINMRLIAIADKYSQGRIAVFLEGGYNLEIVAQSTRITVEALAGKETKFTKESPKEGKSCVPYVKKVIKELKENLAGKSL